MLRTLQFHIGDGDACRIVHDHFASDLAVSLNMWSLREIVI
jgi:hypothetical protein